MSEPLPLDYADRRRSWSAAAIWALLLGLGSGPATVVLVRLTGIAYGISMVGGGISAVVGLAVVAFCVWAFAVSRRPQVRGGSLALIGLLAAVLWSAGLIALFCYIDAHLT